MFLLQQCGGFHSLIVGVKNMKTSKGIEMAKIRTAIWRERDNLSKSNVKICVRQANDAVANPPPIHCIVARCIDNWHRTLTGNECRALQHSQFHNFDFVLGKIICPEKVVHVFRVTIFTAQNSPPSPRLCAWLWICSRFPEIHFPARNRSPSRRRPAHRLCRP